MILDIQSFVSRCISDIALEVTKYVSRLKLVVIMVGNDPASAVYVRNKIQKCAEVGIDGEVIYLEDTICQEDLIQKVQTLNQDSSVTGILVQSPLPLHIDAQKVFNALDPLKDVDGFSSTNVAQLYAGDMT
jgi:methylenetetrahydrofolate dehydrogenase (NADP+)/methenyltetrahydrofolate cyclohydrolase